MSEPDPLEDVDIDLKDGGKSDIDDQSYYERYRYLVEEAEDMLYMLDAEGRYVLVNESMAELTGYDREEILGATPSLILSDEDLTKGENRIRNLIESDEQQTDTWAVTLVTKQGKRIPCELRFTLLPIDDGRYNGIVGVARDIRDRKRREQKLQVMTRILRHNIRNKLGLVMGRADLLRSRAESGTLDPERVVDTANQMESNAREMVELSEKVRTIQERIRSAPESDHRTDIANLARTVVQQFRATHPDVELTTDLPDTMYARVPESYEIALTELVENGIEHYEGTGHPSVHVAIYQEGTRTVTTVRDQCPEIPEAERRVLREERETDLSHSAGVGLWLAYWVAKGTEGELTFGFTGDGNCVELVFDAVDA